MTTGENEPTGEAKEEQPAPEVSAEESKEASLAPMLKHLKILPPLQKKGTLSTDRDEWLDAVPLPPIRAEEPVSSIRAALSEVVGYAHLTNYRFELEEPPTTHEKKTGGVHKPYTVSPYTGKNAVVSVPAAIKSLEEDQHEAKEELVLDDYGDLQALVPLGLRDGSAFRIVLERYDVALVRDHVNRLRSLLDGNAPSATTLDEAAQEETPAKEEGGETASDEAASPTEQSPKESPKLEEGKALAPEAAPPKTDSPTTEKKQEEPSGNERSIKAAEEAGKPLKSMPTFSIDRPVAADGNNLKEFFYFACGEDPALYQEENRCQNTSKDNGASKSKKKKNKKGKSSDDDEVEREEPPVEQVMLETIPRLNELEEATRVKCTIRMSGFHPPPQSRRLIGDLAYLEATYPGETDAVHITAVSSGFYVNRSSSRGGVYVFDPSPAAKPCFSHELLDCMLQYSESFRSAWEAAIAASKERAELMATLNKDGPFSSLFRVAVRGDFKGYKNSRTASAAEGIDALLQCPPWLVPIPKIHQTTEDSWNRNSFHSYNPARTEDELSNSFGVDIRSGAVRDWNEELQSAREMPVGLLQERIERAR